MSEPTSQGRRKTPANEFDFIKYYYIRDIDTNQRRITVCILGEGDEVGRGVALCSMKDQPERKVGRDKAFGRARKALVNRKSHGAIQRSEADMVMMECDNQDLFVWKSEYMPELSELEEKILRLQINK